MEEWEREALTLALLIAGLGVVSILQCRIMRNHAETLIRHDEDITFLRLVARETEKRLADD